MQSNLLNFEVELRDSGASEMTDAAVFLISSDKLKDLEIHPQLDQEIQSLAAKQLFTGKRNEVHLMPTYGLILHAYVMLMGVGDSSIGRTHIREAGAKAAKAADKYKLSSLKLQIQEITQMLEGVVLHQAVRDLTEGFILGNYRMETYHHQGKSASALHKVIYSLDSKQVNALDMKQAITTAEAFAQATNYARDLTNLPGNYLVPSSLADEAARLSERCNFTCEIWDEAEILKRGMGGLHEVGKGSIHPPRFIVMKYQGLEEWTDVLGLVGKGITFDTGGISLKKSAGMEEMISDMGGAAVVMGVMKAVGTMRPKANIIAVIPAAENMPSGSAYKPGDIVTTMSGRTVEVLNTDAEGRIVLADGITYAKQSGADRIIEISTLTGAVLVALGDIATGAVTNNEPFLKQLLSAAEDTDEKIWQLPAYPEYWEMIKSSVADVKNSSGRFASTITAACFIGTFAENTPWIHLDTGGTAWLWNERGIDPKGGTGAMVRTLLQFICGDKG
jgi:leucyl aminopeptidase